MTETKAEADKREADEKREAKEREDRRDEKTKRDDEKRTVPRVSGTDPKRRNDRDDDDEAEGREGEMPDKLPDEWVDPEGPDQSLPENKPYDPKDFPDAPEPGVDPRVPQSNPINE